MNEFALWWGGQNYPFAILSKDLDYMVLDLSSAPRPWALHTVIGVLVEQTTMNQEHFQVTKTIDSCLWRVRMNCTTTFYEQCSRENVSEVAEALSLYIIARFLEAKEDPNIKYMENRLGMTCFGTRFHQPIILRFATFYDAAVNMFSRDPKTNQMRLFKSRTFQDDDCEKTVSGEYWHAVFGPVYFYVFQSMYIEAMPTIGELVGHFPNTPLHNAMVQEAFTEHFDYWFGKDYNTTNQIMLNVPSCFGYSTRHALLTAKQLQSMLLYAYRVIHVECGIHIPTMVIAYRNRPILQHNIHLKHTCESLVCKCVRVLRRRRPELKKLTFWESVQYFLIEEYRNKAKEWVEHLRKEVFEYNENPDILRVK